MTEIIQITRIHLDLDSLPVDIDKLNIVIFGLFRYALDKRFKPPFEFTANVSIKDIKYLNVLKNNNVKILDKSPDKNEVEVLFSYNWKDNVNRLSLITHSPFFSKIESRACIYIDWDNIQVSSIYIKDLKNGILDFIQNLKTHFSYEFYVFLKNKISPEIKNIFIQNNIHIISTTDYRSVKGNYIIQYIQKNTRPGDSICIASGDKSFSPVMIEYVRSLYNVLLVYNKHSSYSFKTNKHWLGAIDVASLNGVNINKKSTKKSINYKSKPCKFYNLYMCNNIECPYLHICGICGEHHPSQVAHPKKKKIKNSICLDFNRDKCNDKESCDGLHICMICKKTHPLNKCKNIVLHCPVCNITVDTSEEYIIHNLSDSHLVKLYSIKKIMDKIKTKNEHILVV